MRSPSPVRYLLQEPPGACVCRGGGQQQKTWSMLPNGEHGPRFPLQRKGRRDSSQYAAGACHKLSRTAVKRRQPKGRRLAGSVGSTFPCGPARWQQRTEKELIRLVLHAVPVQVLAAAAEVTFGRAVHQQLEGTFERHGDLDDEGVVIQCLAGHKHSTRCAIAEACDRSRPRRARDL